MTPAVWNKVDLAATKQGAPGTPGMTEPLSIETFTSQNGRGRILIRAGYHAGAFIVDAEQLDRAVRAVRICTESDAQKQQELLRELRETFK